MTRLGIVGCGAIGSYVARTVGEWEVYDRIVACDLIEERADSVADEVDVAEAGDLAEAASADVVVEAASQDAVREIAEPALLNGATLVLMSVGALGDPELATDIEGWAMDGDGRIRVPSGALGGLDALAGAREAGLDRVKLTTTKSPDGLDLDDVDAPQVLFSDSARRAVREYPENVNVAAALSLVGIGFDDTEVEIVVDPAVDRNRHEVDAVGAFGQLSFSVANDPFPENPKTSFLAALSAIGLLRRLDTRLRVGT